MEALVNDKINYIIGDDFFSINEKIEEICEKNKVIKNENNFFKYSWLASRDFMMDLKKNLLTRNFFYQKIIVIDFEKSTKKMSVEQKEVIKTLFHTESLVFLLFRNKKETTIIKELTPKPKTNIYQLVKLTKIRKNKYITNILNKNYVMYEPNVLEYLNNNLANDLKIIKNEMDKIVLYSRRVQKKISIKNCQEIINSYKEGDFFRFVEVLLKDNKKEIISSYQNLKFQNISALILIATILTYVSLLKQLTVYQKQKKTFLEIVKLMKKSNFFVIKLINISKEINNFKIHKLIKKMYNLDYYIKTSGFEEKTLLEMFLSN